MKSYGLIPIICLVFTLACRLPLYGQDFVETSRALALWNEKPVEIIVDVPGTISEKLDSASKKNSTYFDMRNLKVMGSLNGDDIKSLFDFSIRLYNNCLYRLDLSESRIVEGGDSIYAPEDNVMGGKTLYLPWPEEELLLPNTLKKLITEVIPSRSIIIGDSLMEWPPSSPTIPLGVSYNERIRYTVGFQVSENNPYLSSLDGTLFNKKGDRLLRYGEYEKRTTYTVPEGVREIAAKAFAEAILRDIILPESIRSIGEWAFSYVYGITALLSGDYSGNDIKFGIDWLPSSLEYIGKNAFYHTLCPIIVLPPNVKTIDIEAFNLWRNAFNLNRVGGSTHCELYSTSPIPPVCIPNELNVGPFHFTVRNKPTYIDKDFYHACLYVPTGSKAAYEQAFGWGYGCFEKIIEVDDVMAAAKEAITTLIMTDIQHVLPDSSATEVYETVRYNMQGLRLHRPTKGWNIVRYSDGSTRKIYIK